MRIASTDKYKEVPTPCHLRMRYSHPAILKYARCNKLTTQRKSRSSFFLNGLHGPGEGSASRLRHCVPITWVPSAQKPTNFSKKAFLKVSMQDSGPILLPGLSQKTRRTLKKLAPIRPIRFCKVNDLFISYRWVGGPLKPLKRSQIFNIPNRSQSQNCQVAILFNIPKDP